MVRKTIAYLLDRLPYVCRLRQITRDAGAFPPGHFYSPIPSSVEVLQRLDAKRKNELHLEGIRFNHQEQLEVLKSFAGFYGDVPFPERPSEEFRYHYAQSVFSYPDAIFLYSFLRKTTPARVIEVGSGFSSAVILDTVDRFFAARPQITLIEPHADRLHRLLSENDRKTVRIIEDKVQNVPRTLFQSLEDGDLLFIDSSHVMKCGSDLQYLLFEIVPQLPAGVYVHFHDVFDKFEYPESWLTQGWYWNEAYFLRAFLTDNSTWQIYFFNNYVRNHFADYLAQAMPLCLKDVGGSLYIRRTRN
jgi:hypothetical protein